ncbi:hypothetical protein VME_18250 [Vibrio harveyi 1DA3]|nr:hypothetical protein VME_18250 [Vibrio harveyi 1DA3]
MKGIDCYDDELTTAREKLQILDKLEINYSTVCGEKEILDGKIKFFEYLDSTFKEYRLKPTAETKAFINGLMTASKFFGVTYEELERVIEQGAPKDVPYLDIPTFIRKRGTKQ